VEALTSRNPVGPPWPVTGISLLYFAQLLLKYNFKKMKQHGSRQHLYEVSMVVHFFITCFVNAWSHYIAVAIGDTLFYYYFYYHGVVSWTIQSDQVYIFKTGNSCVSQHARVIILQRVFALLR
jgi:hypothetical protein